MQVTKFISVLMFCWLLNACQPKQQSLVSTFNLKKEYLEFASKMSDGDTIDIHVSLSVCAWFEQDLLQLTKAGDTSYIQLKEKAYYDTLVEAFPKVVYTLSKDSLNLENVMKNLEWWEFDSFDSPFITMIKRGSNDTVRLGNSGLSKRLAVISKYTDVMLQLYPEKMLEFVDFEVDE